MPGIVVDPNGPTSTPWWADPARASVTDSLPITLARKAAGLMGVGGDPNTQAMGMAGGPIQGVTEAPSSLISTLLKHRTQPNDVAAGALTDLLNGFKPKMASSPSDVFSSFAGSGAGSSHIPPPTPLRRMLSNAVSRIPEAADTFEPPSPGMVLPRPRGMSSTWSQQAASRGPAPSMEDSFLQNQLKGAFDRPAVRSFDEIKDIVPTGPKTPYVKPPLSGKWRQKPILPGSQD